jgi:magnesium chelatase family protein
MPPRLIRQHCRLEAASQQLLERAMLKYGLSARAYDRVLKVSRTIADLEGAERVSEAHISEAVQYRTLDRSYWQWKAGVGLKRASFLRRGAVGGTALR